MNASTRLERILAMLEDTPSDCFLRYSLAMEYGKLGEMTRSLELFRGLMSAEPPYVPAFFMAAQQQAREEQVESARHFLREGIEEARRQGDLHAATEMSDFLQQL